MKTLLLIIATSFGIATVLHAQVTLRDAEVQMFYYRLGPPPPGNPCVPTSMGAANSARVDLMLDSDSMQGSGSFRMEILLGSGVLASSVWTGSNSPLSLSAAGSFYPGSTAVRLTGLTGEVVITRVALPWTLTGQNIMTRQFESCHMDGVPFVPSLHLAVRQTGPDQLRIRWTTNVPDLRLVAKDSIKAPAWIAVTNTPNIVGDYFETTLYSPGAQRFFQLGKP